MNGRRPDLPYLTGAVLAVNALPDVALVVDGPYCVTQKAEAQACHDHLSTLFSPVREPRVLPTAQDAHMEEVTSLLVQREPGVAAVMERAAREPGLGALLVTEFDYVHLSGFPLEQVIRRVAASSPVPILRLPCLSLSGDWLDGYAATLDALAQAVPLHPGRQRQATVAVVGYLFDRAEQDHRANLRELARLLGLLGIDCVSTWLGGQGFHDLARVEEASLIVSLPYGRVAARRLGERLSIPVVEVELPLGLGGSERFLRLIGQALDASSSAEETIERETGSVIRDTERAVLRFVAGNRVTIVQDPYLAAVLQEFAGEVGLEVEAVYPVGKSGRDPDAERMVEERALLPNPEPARDCCFVITPSGFYRPVRGQMPVFLGFPNAAEHALLDRPFLGYQGFRHLIESLMNSRLRAELEAGWEAVEARD